MNVSVRYPERKNELYPEGLCAELDDTIVLRSIKELLTQCNHEYSALLKAHGLVVIPKENVEIESDDPHLGMPRINDDGTGSLMHWDVDRKTLQPQISVIHSLGSDVPLVVGEPLQTWAAEESVLRTKPDRTDVMEHTWLRSELKRHRKEMSEKAGSQLTIPDAMRDILRLRMMYVADRALELEELYRLSEDVQNNLYADGELMEVDLYENRIVLIGKAIHARSVLQRRKRGHDTVRVDSVIMEEERPV